MVGNIRVSRITIFELLNFYIEISIYHLKPTLPVAYTLIKVETTRLSLRLIDLEPRLLISRQVERKFNINFAFEQIYAIKYANVGVANIQY